MSLECLEILRCYAFISSRFGYSAFSEYNFVYLSSIDILSSNTSQSIHFIRKHIPPSRTSSPALPSHTTAAVHPSASADTLFFLDTLEYFIPMLPIQEIHQLVPVVQTYLAPHVGGDKKILESAHSVYLAILARGLISVSYDNYIQTTYSVPPPPCPHFDIQLSPPLFLSTLFGGIAING